MAVKINLRLLGEDEDLLELMEKEPPDLAGVLQERKPQFNDIFNARNAESLPTHRKTDYATEPTPRKSPPCQQTYQLPPAKTKALEEYICQLTGAWDYLAIS